MWRAFFMSMGISACIIGGECMVTDRFIIASDQKPAVQQMFPVAAAKQKEIVVAEWAPWSFLSGGAIAILYSLTLPKSGGGGGDAGGGH